MRKELFYNPALLTERIAEEISDRRRIGRLKGTIASGLSKDQISSREFIDMASKTNAIKTAYHLVANVGTWTLLAKTLIPEITVHAFEPIPLYQQGYLDSTAKLDRVTLHKVSAGSDNQHEKFNFSGRSSSFLEVSENLLKMFPNEKKVGEITVEMVKLDDYVTKNNLPLPDLMKLDVKGYELEVLKNALNCMKHCRYIILEVSFIELHIGQSLFDEVVYFMGQHHYRVHAFPYRMHLNQPFHMADVLFENTLYND